jgi:hypothetical protein
MEATEEKEVINWAHDFGINELLHSTAQKIASTYGLLRYNYKDHPDNATWAKLSLEWVTYDTKKIRTFNFATQQEGEAEVDRIVEIYKQAKNIGKTLMEK